MARINAKNRGGMMLQPCTSITPIILKTLNKSIIYIISRKLPDCVNNNGIFITCRTDSALAESEGRAMYFRNPAHGPVFAFTFASGF